MMMMCMMCMCIINDVYYEILKILYMHSEMLLRIGNNDSGVHSNNYVLIMLIIIVIG